MTPVPWSARAEKWARRIIALDWTMVWLWIIALVYFGIRKQFWGAALCVLVAVLFAWDLIYTQDKLAEMLQNKPRSTNGLTTWIQFPPGVYNTVCSCGEFVDIANAQWCPNSVDRGGGRFAIVCPCGIGYFKLKP